MPTRPNNESLLISALINTGDVTQAVGLGLTPEMLVKHRAEYNFVMSYRILYGGAHPSHHAVLAKFPDFPHREDATDVRFAVDEIMAEYTKRELVKSVSAAAIHLQADDIEMAMEALHGFSVPIVRRPQINVLKDKSFLDDYGKPIEAISVPHRTPMSVTGGMREGDLWYVAARLGQGKTWTLLSYAAEALLDGKNVKIYSLEMHKTQIEVRLHVILAQALGMTPNHVEMRDQIFPREKYQEILERIDEQVPGTLHIHDPGQAKVTPALVAANAKDYDLSVIDYIGLMSASNGSAGVEDWRVAASISNQLKAAALANQTRILVASQINRSGDTTGWKPPKTVNLSQTDAIGQDADVVITHKQYSRTTMVYGMEKNRHGAAGMYFWSRFLPNEGKFNEITREQADQAKAADDE